MIKQIVYGILGGLLLVGFPLFAAMYIERVPSNPAPVYQEAPTPEEVCNRVFNMRVNPNKPNSCYDEDAGVVDYVVQEPHQ